MFQGDITTLSVDAIVNAANSQLWMGAGVAGAIKRRGGQEIEREALSKGPIPVGEAVATGAGRLSAKYVIHGAVMGPDLQTDQKKIEETTRSVLTLANHLGVKSVALPAFGTGVGGFSVDKCARIMLDVTVAHLESETSIENVVFALFGKEPFKAFADLLND